MTSPDADQLLASHHACRRLTRASGSNFPAAFALLPAAKRQAMHVLYAFMRHSDDLADDPPPGCDPREALGRWRSALESRLQPASEKEQKTKREPQSLATSPGRESEIGLHDVDRRGRAILPAVAETVREFQIPPQTLLAVLDGVEMDLAPRVYKTFDDLAVYCERVASAVGLACMHIWGFEDAAALPPGRSAGLALQMTNILRDLSEDARRGRVYLPQEDLAACGYSSDDLRRGTVNDAFGRLMKLEIERAEAFYREAAELPRWLHKDGRRIYGLMMDRYHALLGLIRRRPSDVFSRRIRLGRWQKLWLATKWIWASRR